ncbi:MULTISPECIES: hypothetical protein [Streptomyces]|uniref:hypothetical protein n=1 Tax=Streptomyces TaxID=1883 RepID=UPI0033C64D4B
MFVDDTHLHLGESSWLKDTALRTSDFHARSDGQWWAYLPDPARPELAWCVRHHPVHGRSVRLFPLTQAPAGADLGPRTRRLPSPPRAGAPPRSPPTPTAPADRTQPARPLRSSDIAADEPALAEH